MEKYWVAHPSEVFSPCACEVDGAGTPISLKWVVKAEDKAFFIDEAGLFFFL